MRQGLILFLLLLCVAFRVAEAMAVQEAITAVETVTIDLWPDYDAPSLLVLVTGELEADATLPTIVNFPLPEGAQLNAVARITDDNVMTDDVSYSETDEGVRITLPDRRFRVEYYLPYVAEGDVRSFAFTWLADFAVADLKVVVQQPSAARNLRVEPGTATAQEGRDGLFYYSLLPQAVAANAPYSFTVTYERTGEQLTAEAFQGDEGGAGTITAVSDTPTNIINWPRLLVSIGGVLIAIAILWQVMMGQRQQTKRRKPVPIRRQSSQVKAKFCHNCGKAVQQGDQFCRQCGTHLKG